MLLGYLMCRVLTVIFVM